MEDAAEKEIRCVDNEDGRASTIKGLRGKVVVMVNGIDGRQDQSGGTKSEMVGDFTTQHAFPCGLKMRRSREDYLQVLD